MKNCKMVLIKIVKNCQGFFRKKNEKLSGLFFKKGEKLFVFQIFIIYYPVLPKKHEHLLFWLFLTFLSQLTLKTQCFALIQ